MFDPVGVQNFPTMTYHKANLLNFKLYFLSLRGAWVNFFE